VASGLPNNPPRWPEVSAMVKKILYTYKEDARSWERVSDWVERIGWPRFFEKVRPALHQVPHRRLARFTRQPQRVHAHPFLNSKTRHEIRLARQRRALHPPGQRHGIQLCRCRHCQGS
jgi:dissimilatory sulfite reductase (desulfoviridin) alpha/beta subunit